MSATIKGWNSKDYHYSRQQSKRFWKRVNALKDRVTHHDLYCLGCELQNMEERVLRKLREAEQAERQNGAK